MLMVGSQKSGRPISTAWRFFVFHSGMHPESCRADRIAGPSMQGNRWARRTRAEAGLHTQTHVAMFTGEV
jgi:hypothetical protein